MKRTIRRRTEIIIETREIMTVHRGRPAIEDAAVEAYAAELPLLEGGDATGETESPHSTKEEEEEEL